MVGVRLNTQHSHQPFTHAFKKLETEYRNAPSLFQQVTCGIFTPPEDQVKKTQLYERLITWAFQYKNAHSNFNLSSLSLAKKAHDAALKMIHHAPEQKERVSSYLMDHPELVAFLTNKQHFLYRHVEVITAMEGQRDVKLHLQEEVGPNNENQITGLYFNLNGTIENVDSLMAEAKAAPEKVLYLNPFKINRYALNQLCNREGLRPSFQCPKDDRFYVAICTFNIADEPTARAQHTWLRLYDGEKGEMSSVGTYPYKKPACNNLYMVEQGRFEDDSYEYVNPPKVSEFRVPLTKTEYLRLHEHISSQIRDSFTPEGISYALHNANCSDWSMDKVDPFLKLNWNETRMEFIFTLIPSLYKKCRLWSEKYPKLYRVLLQPLLTLASWGMHLFRLGFTYFIGVRKNNHKCNPKAKSVIDTEGHLSIDISKVSHPYLLRRLLLRNRVAELSKGRIHIMRRDIV